MKFTKMQGCGNDYVYVDTFGGEEVADPAGLARRISDRRFGVGSDGLILMQPTLKADIGMEMYNADGSRSPMCGNGLRCLAKYAYEHGLVSKTEFEVETGAGVLPVRLHLRDGKVERVTVVMGEPRLNRQDLPMEGPAGPAIEVRVKAGGREVVGTAVSMGNPHFVVFVEGDVDRYPVAEAGPALETHPLFPERVNAEFVQVLGPRALRQRTWERGAGETWACGSGACAVAVAAIVTGRATSPVTVHLRGGDLEIAWEGKGKPVVMTGPAVEVCSGVWPDG